MQIIFVYSNFCKRNFAEKLKKEIIDKKTFLDAYATVKKCAKVERREIELIFLF